MVVLELDDSGEEGDTRDMLEILTSEFYIKRPQY